MRRGERRAAEHEREGRPEAEAKRGQQAFAVEQLLEQRREGDVGEEAEAVASKRSWRGRRQAERGPVPPASASHAGSATKPAAPGESGSERRRLALAGARVTSSSAAHGEIRDAERHSQRCPEQQEHHTLASSKPATCEAGASSVPT